jgi:hypothetical protein
MYLQSVLAMPPLYMVTVASPPLRELCAPCVKIPTLTSRTLPQESRALSLFPATFMADSHLLENTMALSPAFATLTGNVNRKPFVCHSYVKTGGVGDPQRSSQRNPSSLYRTLTRPLHRDHPTGYAQQRPQLQSFYGLTSQFSGYPGGGVLPCPSHTCPSRPLGPRSVPPSLAPETGLQHPSVTLSDGPSWERAYANGGVTRVKALGR